jgi:hypothetical protein
MARPQRVLDSWGLSRCLAARGLGDLRRLDVPATYESRTAPDLGSVIVAFAHFRAAVSNQIRELRAWLATGHVDSGTPVVNTRREPRPHPGPTQARTSGEATPDFQVIAGCPAHARR